MSDRGKAFTARKEKQFLKRAAQIAGSRKPNPSRTGCPGRDLLEKVAYRRQPPDSLDPAVVDHIANCSPCFNEYTHLREHRRTVKLVTIAIIGACLGGGILISAWLSQRGQPTVTRKEPRPSESKRETTARLNPTVSAVVDLRLSSPTRSEKGKGGPQVALPRVPRAVVGLTIMMPLGSEEGEYEIEFWASGDRRSETYRGQASLQDQAEVLDATADTRSLPAGEYELRLRTTGGVWQSFRVQLE